MKTTASFSLSSLRTLPYFSYITLGLEKLKIFFQNIYFPSVVYISSTFVGHNRFCFQLRTSFCLLYNTKHFFELYNSISLLRIIHKKLFLQKKVRNFTITRVQTFSRPELCLSHNRLVTLESHRSDFKHKIWPMVVIYPWSIRNIYFLYPIASVK